jgi:hypothetical protein
MANTRSIGGVGRLYYNATAEDAATSAPTSSSESGITLPSQALAYPAQEGATAAGLLGNVYYNFPIRVEQALPVGTLVLFGEELPLQLNRPCYYLQLEDARIFTIELRRDPAQNVASYTFVAHRQAHPT